MAKRPEDGKDRASCQSGGAPALRPGAIAHSPGREVPCFLPISILIWFLSGSMSQPWEPTWLPHDSLMPSGTEAWVSVCACLAFIN